MRIGELAKQVCLPIDTIRFYEKRGLLFEGRHFVRQSNRYRDYTAQAIESLELIKRGQAAGLTLAELAASLQAWEANTLTAKQKRDFFQNKIKEIDARIKELEGMKRYLRKKMRRM